MPGALGRLPSEPSSSRVLVLGAGFIGAHIVSSLVRAGFGVDVLTRSEPRPELAALLDGASVALGDVVSMLSMGAALDRVDHVVYAVGSSSPVESDLDPAGDVALVVPPVVRLLESLRLKPSVTFTYLSSGGAVYGNVDTELVAEDTATVPISSYGILKQTAEQYIRMYSSLYGVAARTLRLANVYGPNQPWAKGHGIVPRLMRCAMTGEVFPIYGDGLNVRDYVYVEDVAAAVTRLLAAGSEHTVLNVGSGRGHTILDIVREVEKATGRKVRIEFRASRPFDVRSIVLDNARLADAIDFRTTDLFEGIRRSWHAFVDVQGHEPESAGLVTRLA